MVDWFYIISKLNRLKEGGVHDSWETPSKSYITARPSVKCRLIHKTITKM